MKNSGNFRIAAMQTHEFFDRSRSLLGAEKLRRVLGFRTVQSVYPLCHPTLEENPDANGLRNPQDRMDDLKDALASHGDDGRALLVEWQMREELEHARRVGAKSVRADAREVGEAVSAFGEFLTVCGDPEKWTSECAERVVREGAEAVNEIMDLIRAAVQVVKDERPRPRNLRAG